MSIFSSTKALCVMKHHQDLISLLQDIGCSASPCDDLNALRKAIDVFFPFLELGIQGRGIAVPLRLPER